MAAVWMVPGSTHPMPTDSMLELAGGVLLPHPQASRIICLVNVVSVAAAMLGNEEAEVPQATMGSSALRVTHWTVMTEGFGPGLR